MWALVCVKYSVVHLFDKREPAEHEQRAYDALCGMHHLLTDNIHVESRLIEKAVAGYEDNRVENSRDKRE